MDGKRKLSSSVHPLLFLDCGCKVTSASRSCHPGLPAKMDCILNWERKETPSHHKLLFSELVFVCLFFITVKGKETKAALKKTDRDIAPGAFII